MHEKSYIDHVFSLWLSTVYYCIVYLSNHIAIILNFCPESMSHKNNIFQWKEHWLRNRSLKCQPSTSFCECLYMYTINKLNNILSFYIGNETNFFNLFMKGVFFEIFYDIVKLNMVFIPTKPILFVCIKLCICIYCCWYIKVLYTPPVLHMIFFVISDT